MLANPVSRFCQSCGNELENSGGCNVCLLQLGISQAGAPDARPSDVSLPSLDELNAEFPQLEITRLVGRGGMGAIYHARQTALDRDVALKLIAKEVSSDDAFVERFEREAKTLAKLSHPNIVTIFDFGRTPDGIAYLIMEFVDGINLREAISDGSIGSDDALHVVATICRALEYAHSKGVVHRDIKPENILLGEDGSLKVADFGIAKIVDESVRTPTLTATRQVLGSLHYLAPEHLEAPNQVDHRVDLYALGVVFYELLTGQLPLGRYEAPSAIDDRVDHRLDAVVLKTLSRKPEQRYQNATELGADIGEIATSIKVNEIPHAAAVDSNSRPEPARARKASVPFSCEAMWGFGEAVGVIHAKKDLLCAEFRLRDVWGATKSKTHVVEIPCSNLTRLEFVPSVFGSKLIVTVDKISALDPFPNAETGRVELNIKRSDGEYAREVVHALGFDVSPATARLGPAASSGPVASPHQLLDTRRLTFALLMIVCGAANGGGLAITEAIFASELRGIAFMAASIGAAVFLGPLALMQLITGVLNLFCQPRSLNFATAVISMIPLSPVWIVSFPTGLWAYRWMNPAGATSSLGTRNEKKKWGATTLMFMRESRWARVVGLLNAVGLTLIVAAITAFKLGYYPAEMRYRIVDKNTEYGVLDKAVNARLKNSPGFRETKYDYDYFSKPTHLIIRTWRRSRNQVENLLSVQETPQLVWLQAATANDGFAAAQSAGQDAQRERLTLAIPVVSGIDATSLRTEEQGFGMAVYATAPPFDLSPESVGRVSADNSDEATPEPVRPTLELGQLVVELTSSGREQLEARLAGGDSTGGLGLVLGGVVEGLATKASISHKQIIFQLPKTSDLTGVGIAAGIRGPNIPTALELLD